MRIRRSIKSTVQETSSQTVDLAEVVSEAFLRNVVESISIPRHFLAQPRNNRIVAEFIADHLSSYGYQVSVQGQYSNLLATSAAARGASVTLVGAHYDSVPSTPGADDNASGIAVMLHCARVFAELECDIPVCFAAFNCEEDGLLGSSDFVEHYLPSSGFQIRVAHILEMVGYCSNEPDSQQVPRAIPIREPDIGNFIGLIGNRDSNAFLDAIIDTAGQLSSALPAIGLKVYLGLEKRIPELGRSDHEPFWRARIPALMWTDTAEFRNHNYHEPGDTPETLDYVFMRRVTQLLISSVMFESG